MGLIRLATASGYAVPQTGGSQSNIGTATTLTIPARVKGDTLLNGAAATSPVLIVTNAAFSQYRMRVRCGNSAGTVTLQLYNGTTLAASCTIAASSLDSATWYRLVAYLSPGGHFIGLYEDADDGAVLTSGTGTGSAIANSSTANGVVFVGAPAGGTTGDIDAVAVYGAVRTSLAQPSAGDADILWYVPVTDAEAGTTNAANAVSGATALDTFSNASIVAGGTWNGAAAAEEGAISEGAEAGDSWSAAVEAGAVLAEGAEAGDSFSATSSSAEAGAIAEGAVAGDSFGAAAEAAASIAEGANAGFLLGYEAAIDTADEGALAGDSFTAAVTADAGIAEGAKAGESISADSSDAVSRTISQTALAGDSWVVTVDLGAGIAEGARAGETLAAQTTTAATITEGARAGDGFGADADNAIDAALAETALAGDSWSVAVDVAAALLEGAVVGEAVLAQAVVSASFAEGARAGESWSSRTPVVVRIITLQGQRAGPTVLQGQRAGPVTLSGGV